MNPEHSGHERFLAYTDMLKERFDAGMLAELQDQPQWVLWRAELEDGKHKKVPYNPYYRNARASVKIPKSWGSLDHALTALESGTYSGLGFMITPPLVMIDLDPTFRSLVRTFLEYGNSPTEFGKILEEVSHILHPIVRNADEKSCARSK